MYKVKLLNYLFFLIVSMVLSGNMVPVNRFNPSLKIIGHFFPALHARNIIMDLAYRNVVNVTAFTWLIGLALGYLMLAFIFYRFKRYDV